MNELAPEILSAVALDSTWFKEHEITVGRELWIENNIALVGSLGANLYLHNLVEVFSEPPLAPQQLTSKKILQTLMSPFYTIAIHPSWKETRHTMDSDRWIMENTPLVQANPRQWLSDLLFSLTFGAQDLQVADAAACAD